MSDSNVKLNRPLGRFLTGDQMKFNSAYKHVHDKPKTEIKGDSLTEQSHKDRVCINRIMARFAKTGAIDQSLIKNGNYIDVDAVDFQEAMITTARANESFNALPAKVRAKFNNDPVSFLKWLGDPENAAEAVSMGLAKPEDKQEPIKVHVTNAAEPAESQPAEAG